MGYRGYFYLFDLQKLVKDGLKKEAKKIDEDKEIWGHDQKEIPVTMWLDDLLEPPETNQRDLPFMLLLSAAGYHSDSGREDQEFNTIDLRSFWISSGQIVEDQLEDLFKKHGGSDRLIELWRKLLGEGENYSLEIEQEEYIFREKGGHDWAGFLKEGEIKELKQELEPIMENKEGIYEDIEDEWRDWYEEDNSGEILERITEEDLLEKIYSFCEDAQEGFILMYKRSV